MAAGPSSVVRVGKPTPLTSDFWRAALRAVIVTTCGTLPVFLVGGLAVQIRADLGLRVSQIGILTAVFFGSSALLSAFVGRVAEGTGAAVAMRVAASIAVVALLGASLVQNYVQLILVLIVAGAASATAQVGTNLYISRHTHESRQGFAYGIKQSAIPAATLLGGLAVPLVALTVGWRWAFAGGALLALIVAATVRGAGVTSVRRTWQGTRRPDVGFVALATLSIGAGIGSAAANAVGAYLVDSSVAAGASEASAGLIFAAGSALGLSMRIGVGWFADRYSGGRLLWVSALLLVGTIGFAGLATRTTALLLPATLVCFAGGWGWPGLFTFAIARSNPSAPAAATGITQTGVYIGGVTGPLVFGLLAEHLSYGVAWSTAAAAGFVSSIVIVFGRRLLLRDMARAGVGRVQERR